MQKTIIAAVSGILAGVTIGLLLAPKKGKDTRSDVVNGMKSGWRKITGKNGVNLDDDPWAAYNARKAQEI